jgi:hypothetical protein
MELDLPDPGRNYLYSLVHLFRKVSTFQTNTAAGGFTAVSYFLTDPPQPTAKLHDRAPDRVVVFYPPLNFASKLEATK